MLLTKEVEMKWNSKNKKYYESKGYIYTKMGEGFIVKVEDLPKGSKALVEVKCDCEDCNNPYLKPMSWQAYLEYKKEDNKYYCNNCSHKMFAGKNIALTRLKNSKSFEQWCIENNRQDLLDRWDYELNKCKPSEISYGSTRKCCFKCPRELHDSKFFNINGITNSENSVLCKQCNSFAQWGIDNICEDFLEKYWDWEKNIVNPWEIAKSSNKEKIWIKCQEKDYHGSYKTDCGSFIYGARCPYCANKQIHPLDSLGTLYPEVLKIWSDKNKKSPFEYSPKSGNCVWWKCQEGKHKDYYRNIASSNELNFKCPNCSIERNESFLQEKVKTYLNSLNYTILHERNCTIVPRNPKTKQKLPFDNEIKELKLIIEVHGIQHYKESKGYYKGKLHYQKVKDRYKRIFAKKQGYFYLEISYWTDDKEETWKKLIDNKINEILNN